MGRGTQSQCGGGGGGGGEGRGQNRLESSEAGARHSLPAPFLTALAVIALLKYSAQINLFPKDTVADLDACL